MLSAISPWMTSLFSKQPPAATNLDETRKCWSCELDQSLHKNNQQIDTLWKNAIDANKKSGYSPQSSEIELINQCYEGADSASILTPTLQPIASSQKSKKDLSSLIAKLWYNTLKLFTYEHHVHDIESRSFFDVGSLMRKLSTLAQFTSFALVNQYTIAWISAALGITSALAGMVAVALSIALSLGGIYLFHLYAEGAIKKPLRDPTSGDTINLTKVITQSVPLPEVGREVDIDQLETALSPPGAIVGLIGHAGAGKTEMAKFLAQRIAAKTCIPALKGLQLYYVNGAQVTRQYIEKLKEQIKDHESEVILCIDEAEGIFNASKAQNILKNAWISGPAPRLLLITTTIKYESSFLCEDDGSWQSRIQPCLNLKAISDTAMVPVLYERLKSHFPWMKISPQTIAPLVPMAKECLRIAIRRLDNLAADFKRCYDSSPLLQQLNEKLQILTIEKVVLRAGKTLFELSKDQAFREINEKIQAIKDQIQAETSRLSNLRTQLHQYQQIVELERKWNERAYTYWLEHKASNSPADKRMILASSIWAGEVFLNHKSRFTEILRTELSSASVEKWLKEHPEAPLTTHTKSQKPQQKSGKQKGKANPTDSPSSDSSSPGSPSPFIPSMPPKKSKPVESEPRRLEV